MYARSSCRAAKGADTPPDPAISSAIGGSTGSPARAWVPALETDTPGASVPSRARSRRSTAGDRHTLPVHTASTDAVTAAVPQSSGQTRWSGRSAAEGRLGPPLGRRALTVAGRRPDARSADAAHGGGRGD